MMVGAWRGDDWGNVIATEVGLPSGANLGKEERILAMDVAPRWS
jgi:hypothetical protein